MARPESVFVGKFPKLSDQRERITLRQKQQMFSTTFTGTSRVLVIEIVLGKGRPLVKVLYKVWDS